MIEPIIQEDVNALLDANPGLSKKITGKSYLVTGATGGIGRYAVCALAENARRTGDGSIIVAHARNQAKAKQIFSEYLDMDNFHLQISDVGDLQTTDHDIDYILHAASPTQPEDFLERPVDIINANVKATMNLLELARNKSARFCLLSTLEVYGEVASETYPAYVTESNYGALDSLSLRSSYPESKRLAENLCIAYQAQYGVSSTIIRVAPVISPIVEPNDSRVFAKFINDVSDSKNLVVYTDVANKKRSYTYIADAVSGIFTALLDSSPGTNVYNLANNESVASIKELAETVIACVNNTESTLSMPTRDDNSNTSTTTGLVLLDSSRLLEAGWSPIYTLENSVNRALQYKQKKE